MSWTLYNLARFPEHQEKCREEIDAVLGSKEEFEWYYFMLLEHACRARREILAPQKGRAVIASFVVRASRAEFLVSVSL